MVEQVGCRNEEHFDDYRRSNAPDGLERRVADNVLVGLEQQESYRARKKTGATDEPYRVPEYGQAEKIADQGIASHGAKPRNQEVESKDEPPVHIGNLGDFFRQVAS